jgi:DNA-binding NarL/FixJ family response regulator
MNKKTVLIVEDDPTNKLSLLSALRMRGFRAEAAADVTEARGWADKLGEQIDVMVLDMRLEDRHHDLTGADLGLEVREAHPKWPPEFLIFSGYKQVDYYEAALRLDAAAYLTKGAVEQEDLIRHIRSLALRRALSAERVEIVEKIRLIAQRSHTPSAAIINFCRQLLAPEVGACLGLPFIFMLSDRLGTQNCGSNTDLPFIYHPAYTTIQALAYSAGNYSEPFVFNHQYLNDTSGQQTSEIYQKLDGAAFLPISINRDFRLSLGILKGDGGQHLSDEPDKLAASIHQYASLSIVESMLLTLTQWHEVKSNRNLTYLSEAARLYLYIGQEQLAILSEAEEAQKLSPRNESFQKLKALALSLRTTGEQLSMLHGAAEAASGPVTDAEPVDVAKIVQQAWEEIKEQFQVEGMMLEESGSPFFLVIERGDLLLIVLRVLQWMVQRVNKVPASARSAIAVEYSTNAETVEISFTDASRRLSPRLRQLIFEPFTQVTVAPLSTTGTLRPAMYDPLYLAKMLVEIKLHGLLEDRTGMLEGGIGHRLVMSFPAAMGKQETASAVSGA